MTARSDKRLYQRHEYSGPRKSRKRVAGGLRRYTDLPSRRVFWRAHEKPLELISIDNDINDSNTTSKKRGRPGKLVKEDNIKCYQNKNKKPKVLPLAFCSYTLPDIVTRKSPVENAAQLLNEIVPDDKSLIIKIEFDDPDSVTTSENLPEEQQIDEVKSEPSSPSSQSEADESNHFEYLDTPYMSRTDMVLNMAPITEKEEETYADLYESKLMDATCEYDWCNDTGECMFDFFWIPLPDPPEPYEKRYCKLGEVKSKDPTLKDKVGPIKEFTSYEAFTEIWNKEVMEIVFTETNKNGKKSNDDWIDTTIDELYVFLAITLAINMDANDDLNELWQNSNLIKISNLSQTMTYERFVALNVCLSFSDVNVDISKLTESQATVSKIKPIITQLNKNFSVLYQIGQNIVFDEPYQVCKRNGELIKMRKTPGIKEVNICDAKTGYTRSIVLQTSKKDGTVPPRGISPILIVRFMQMEAYKEKGYSIWCNNIFNSPILVRTAYVLNFNFVGTIGITDNIDLKYVKTKKEDLKDGEVSGASDVNLDYILWRDDNLVSLVSTYHGKTTNEDIGRKAPAAFVDFINNVASLDKRDIILADYVVETEDWVRRMFNRLLNISIYNSSILIKCAELTSDSHREFRLNLIQKLIIQHGPKVQLTSPSKESVLPPQEPILPVIESVSSSIEPLLMPREPILPCKEPIMEGDNVKKIILPEKYWEHYPEEYGIVPGKKRQKIKKACVLCQKPSQTMCPACNVSLCLSSCHRLYHSMLSQ